MSRWKAAGIHLSISVCIAFAALGLMLGVWYPPPFFHADGAGKLELILVGVDLSLGPLLTLIIFKSGKKGLRFDLAVIATVQAIALVYGMSVVLRTRPVFLVAAVDRFVLVSANDLSASDLAGGSKPEFRRRSWTGPRLVAALLPANATERSQILTSSLAGKDIERLPKYYADYTANAKTLLKHAKTVEQLPKQNPTDILTLDKWLVDHHRSRNDIVWVPLTARFSDLTALLDRQTGKWLGAITVNPW